MKVNTILVLITVFVYYTHVSLADDDETQETELKTPNIPTVKLKTGYDMPILGCGTGRQGMKVIQATNAAINFGYRLIDTAKLYMVTKGVTVERVLGRLIQKSGVPREDFFIVTKILPSHFSEETCINAIEESLSRLNTSYIDLVLLHTSSCLDVSDDCMETGTYIDGWKSLELLVDKGLIRSIGVSNFYKNELSKIHEIAKHPISVVQNWFDPYNQDKMLRIECEYMDIVYMAYSTLGGNWYYYGIEPNPILNDDVINKIANRHNTSSAEVVLQWAMASGTVVIPASTKEMHIATNLKSLNLKLTEDEMIEIDELDGKMEEMLRNENDNTNENENSPSDEL